MHNLLPHNGSVFLYPGFFSKYESDKFYGELLNTVNWQQLPIKIFGKEVMQPRLTAWFADEGTQYAYSGLTLQAFEWTESLLEIKTRVEKVSDCKFNSALLNLYRDGNDSMGWHRDNEKELGVNPPVASVSFGETRKFQLRTYVNKSDLITIPLQHGSFLLMKDETQHYWEHRVPKELRIKGSRINITFRGVKQ
jgi:alkylated DNA repair dioxygenase AlkB